ncbi:hypothetical protein [Streptomyces sp. NPDC002889]|uniref:hypothetical protein n=1 Tax=Streptomyces sp. NPDC002889 TaxID=3364669 RepID=UPI00367C6193
MDVETAGVAVRLADLPPARQPTVVVLAHEGTGIPPEALDLLDDPATEPPEGSLALYEPAGLL